MELIQNGYACDYELNVYIKMFFSKDDNVLIKNDFKHENDIITVHTSIIFEGREYSSDYSFPFVKIENKKLTKKIYTTSCVKSFCHAAEKIRKVSIPWGVMSGIRPAKNVRCLLEDGLSDQEVYKFLHDVYEVTPQKIKLAFEVAKNEAAILKDFDKNAVSIYIGIPFCPTRCLYCSFVSTDMRVSGKYMNEYVNLLQREIEKTAEVMKKMGAYAETIYIGGGTPTTLSAKQLEDIFDCIKNNFNLSRVNEFTLEAGRPDTITEEKLNAAINGGVNRISINPQTMHSATLEKVGRTHLPEDVRKSFKIAREAGFKNINMDLIAGLLDETAEMFNYSLDEVIKLDPENITVHTMCIKRAAALSSYDAQLTHADEVNKMLEYAQLRMSETGYAPYYMYRQKNILGNLENVGYAKDGYMSMYNIKIMEEVQTIIALGGGGATKIVIGDRIERIFNFKDPYEYIRRFDEILSRKDEILKVLGII